jgi:hypothetical protein
MICDQNSAAAGQLTPTRPQLPPVLCSRILDCLPLHVRHRIGTAAGERHKVILRVAWTGTAREAD